ncbi:acetylornithine transaminase [Alteribacter keqinensis]|uniref:Acetylornithine aminotransferase n=1 Tax=Alteribacter keqinensis TaxID=2483800 RepID=A0A3M7TYB9_9BACI|nr:acetylornithine transaminase [Alteribacter keqinensis]
MHQASRIFYKEKRLEQKLQQIKRDTVLDNIMQNYQRFPIEIVKGKGSSVWDADGKKYLDYTSGIAVCNLGHVPDAVKEAVENQLESLWHCSNLYHIPAQKQLAEALTRHSFGDQVFFCNSGAEANEAAIKLARKYAADKGQKNTHDVVTFAQSFHGRTLATLTATGQSHVKAGFDPLPEGFQHLEFNDTAALDAIAAKRPCAVLLELVQGEGGIVPADTEWVRQLEGICKQNDILLILDEVQTGVGRTGKLFAYEHYGITPDVMTLAKGLGSGFPIGAVIAGKDAAASFTPGSHGTTFGGNPLASTAGLATLKEILDNNVIKNAEVQSDYLFSQLKRLESQFSLVQSVRGKGLLAGMEVSCPAKEIVIKALEKGVLILTAGANVVRLLPPLTTKKEEIDEVAGVLENILTAIEEKGGVKL